MHSNKHKTSVDLHLEYTFIVKASFGVSISGFPASLHLKLHHVVVEKESKLRILIVTILMRQ